MKTVAFVFFILNLFGTLCPAEQKVIRVHVFPLPGLIETADKGAFVEVLKIIESCLPAGYRPKNEMYPPARAMANLLGSEPLADAVFPAINIPSRPGQNNGLGFTGEGYGKASFVIYSNIKKPITREQLLSSLKSEKFPFLVETFPAIADSFPFPIQAFTCLECSLKKVAAGHLDATIMAMDETDELIRKEGFRTIHREFYEEYDAVFTVADSAHGREVTKVLNSAVRCAEKKPLLKKLYGVVHKPFVEWQPSKL